jgi:hypothetical protein
LAELKNGEKTTELIDRYIFYIVDGTIVHTSPGVKSSLTISVLAFRIARNITGLITTGFSINSGYDHDNMSKQFHVYDALHAFCRLQIGKVVK